MSRTVRRRATQATTLVVTPLALAHSSSPSKHIAAILKAAEFLCGVRYDGAVKDKWLLRLYDQDQMDNTFDSLMNAKVPLILCQVVTRVLSSFESPPPATEAVPYGTLALTNLASIPWLGLPGLKIAATIEQGQFVGLQALKTGANCLWIGKATFHCLMLSNPYRLAALEAVLLMR
ncbi:MAG: hypothetical protein Q9188_000387 [Gyalolechia gomerana]